MRLDPNTGDNDQVNLVVSPLLEEEVAADNVELLVCLDLLNDLSAALLESSNQFSTALNLIYLNIWVFKSDHPRSNSNLLVTCFIHIL